VNDILKQRLVGALILVALGVIFWPIIFIQPDATDTVEPRSIPPTPGVSVEPMDAPGDAGLRASPELTALQESAAREPAQQVDAVPDQAGEPEPSPSTEGPGGGASTSQHDAEPAGRATRTEAPGKLAMDSDGVPIAWTLQVATLSSAQKADDLRRRLLALDHKAYVVKVRRDGKTLYRVCVGPKFERAEIEKLKQGIDSTFGVSSLVARYVP
jgi:DedD protein